jgi:hypothetical protein
MFKATYIYSVFQYQACVYRTQDQYDKSHIILTEMLQTEDARAILSVECISAIELKPSNDLLIFKNTQTFLSPTTKEFQRSIDKAASSAKVIYNRNELKAARKNILQSVDHILGHDLVQENPQAAAFVAELERKVQEIKEEFTKSIYSITGTMHGNEGELMFPAFQSRKRKNVDKRFKGLSG